jgi:hypothetical protein
MSLLEETLHRYTCLSHESHQHNLNKKKDARVSWISKHTTHIEQRKQPENSTKTLPARADLATPYASYPKLLGLCLTGNPKHIQHHRLDRLCRGLGSYAADA